MLAIALLSTSWVKVQKKVIPNTAKICSVNQRKIDTTCSTQKMGYFEI